MSMETKLYDFAVCLLEMGDRASLEVMQCQAKEKIMSGGGEYKIINSRTIGSRSASVDIMLDALTSFTVIARAISDWDDAEQGEEPYSGFSSIDFRCIQ